MRCYFVCLCAWFSMINLFIFLLMSVFNEYRICFFPPLWNLCSIVVSLYFSSGLVITLLILKRLYAPLPWFLVVGFFLSFFLFCLLLKIFLYFLQFFFWYCDHLMLYHFHLGENYHFLFVNFSVSLICTLLSLYVILRDHIF